MSALWDYTLGAAAAAAGLTDQSAGTEIAVTTSVAAIVPAHPVDCSPLLV